MNVGRHIKNWMFVAALTGTWGAGVSYAEQEVGNGGDPVQLIFGKARVDALTVAEAFRGDLPEHEWTQHFDRDVYVFLTGEAPQKDQPVHTAMRTDVRDSEHLFFDPDQESIEQSTCARTNLPSHDDTLIRFSLPKCRSLLDTNGQDIAVTLLLHESVHHFGVGGSREEEDFAWRVGRQLVRYWKVVRDRKKPNWNPISLVDGPSSRYQHGSALISARDGGSRVLVWGGCNNSKLPDRESCHQFLDTGKILSVRPHDADKTVVSEWGEVPTEGAPSGRKLVSTVFTKDPKRAEDPASPGRVIVWGGCRGDDPSCREYPRAGGIYDLEENAWSPLPAPAFVTGRIQHTAIWTGASAIFWGGRGKGEQVYRDGFRLWLGEDGQPRWQKLPEAPVGAARFGHSTVQTENGFIVWGGCHRPGLINCADYRADGYRYDARTGEWSRLPEVPWAIKGRAHHVAGTNGQQMVVWGGQRGFNRSLSDGALFDLKDGSWTQLDSLLPEGEGGRYWHQATWTGDALLIFGGEEEKGAFKQSVLKLKWLPGEPSQQSWKKVATETSPIGRKGHTQLWTPQGLLVWGGYGADQTFLPTGAVLRQP